MARLVLDTLVALYAQAWCVQIIPRKSKYCIYLCNERIPNFALENWDFCFAPHNNRTPNFGSVQSCNRTAML